MKNRTESFGNHREDQGNESVSLTFCRHGKTAINVLRGYQGAADSALLPEGVKKAEKSAYELVKQGKRFRLVVLSPKYRVKQTWEAMKDILFAYGVIDTSTIMKVDESFTERHYGFLELYLWVCQHLPDAPAEDQEKHKEIFRARATFNERMGFLSREIYETRMKFVEAQILKWVVLSQEERKRHIDDLYTYSSFDCFDGIEGESLLDVQHRMNHGVISIMNALEGQSSGGGRQDVLCIGHGRSGAALDNIETNANKGEIIERARFPGLENASCKDYAFSKTQIERYIQDCKKMA